MDGVRQSDTVADTASHEPLDLEEMRRAVAEIAGIPPYSLGDHDDLIEVGLDSIAVMRLAGLWSHRGAAVKYSELLERRTLAEWWALALLRRSAPRGPSGTPDRADEPTVFELAPMQQAYWIGRAEGQELATGAHVYLEFDGRGLDPQRLEAAVRALFRRHGMLRARILADGRQEILAESPWPGLVVTDLRAHSPEGADEVLAGTRDELSNSRLDVARGLGFDLRLSQLPGGEHRLHVKIDMLVADALSFRVIVRDLAHLYTHPELELPPLRFSYARYRAWRAGRPAAGRGRAETYWRERLDAMPDPPRLPLAVDPSQVERPRVTRREVRMLPAERERLTELARRYRVTPAMVFATAFAEVLAAWSIERRFLMNLPLFDREPVHPDVGNLVGDFTSSLVLAVDFGPRVSFADAVKWLQAQFQADVAHAEYSGLHVLRALGRARGTGPVRAPVVFTSALGMGDLIGDDVRSCFGDLAWMSSQTPQVWLDHQVTELGGGLLLNLDAVEQLFPPGVLDVMFEAYLGLIRWLLRADGTWDEPPPSLLPSSQRAVRAAANATEAAARCTRLHEAFFARAAAEPESVALAWGTDSIRTYGELALGARRVAGLLRDRGVRPGERVALTIPRGPAQVEALLGVLCAGAVYVPVGLDQPPARRDRIYAAAGVRVVLSLDGGHRPCDIHEGLQVVSFEGAALSSPVAAAEPVTDSSLAYILFTSGSTGEPKGVMVSHRAAMNTVEGLNDRFRVSAGDRTIGISALDFDLSVYDIFGPLSVGGALVLADDDARRDAGQWAALVRRWGVTIWQSAPALLDMLLVEAERTGGFPGLRLALLGGDRVSADLAPRLEKAASGSRLVGLGGTTETAIHSTALEVTEIPAHWQTIPYGFPLRNVRCRVVDERGVDRPDWVQGELWIGGVSVAEGYLNDPERTASRFVTYEGVRWYRTGDLARYWPDGTLEFLGRADCQVKVRGHRIELGEVEAALEAHPLVARAAVTTGGGARSGHLLAAVVRAGPGLDPEALLAFVAERLPGFMVPRHAVLLEQLPLDRNGKIDRKEVARRAEDDARPDPSDGEPPRGDVEVAVAAVWAELLGVANPTREANFFKLGGDSLIAIRMVGRLCDAGIRRLVVGRVFASPVLKDFTAGLSLDVAASLPAAVAADPDRRYEPFPLTDAQQAYWLGRSADFVLGGVGSYWYWEFDGEGVDLGQLEAALNRLIGRHEMLRAVLVEGGFQRILAEVPRYTIPRTSAPPGDEPAHLARFREQMSHRVMDPTRWPLFEVRALDYSGNRTRLGFGFDYVVLDALSISIVLAELSRLYEDPAATLPPIGLSFRDYVVALRTSPGAAPESDSCRDDCREELPPPPQLPLRTSPAAVTAPRFKRREVRLPAQQWVTITGRARGHGLTASSVLATTFAEVLSAWSGRDELTLNLTLFDRNEVHPDVRHILGDFTSLMLVPYRPDRKGGLLASALSLQAQVGRNLGRRGASSVRVTREMARRSGATDAAMPVVFTSTLGLADGLVDLATPFGHYVGGLSQTPQVWLDCQVMQSRGELLVNWDAVEELFPKDMLDAMFAAFLRLLDWLGEACSDWEGPVPNLLPEAQRQVRTRVNATEGPESGCVLHEAFFRRAARDPGRLALAWGTDGRLSYGELAERALGVAALLERRGVGPGDLIGVALPSGPEQVAAVLGVLASGAVYVPVGIGQPAKRRSRIFEKAGVRLVLDDIGEARGVPPLHAPVPVPRDALAYVIHTSGSTGEPKLVEITHRAAMNTVDEINTRFGVCETDRVLAVSAFDFDLSVYDVFGLLSVGGGVVLMEEEARREARRWAELVRSRKVTVWNSVPALLDMLLATGAPEAACAGLRLALLSGDWIGLDLPGRLAAGAPGCRFVALGGATEASIWSNAIEVAGVPHNWRSIPYGYPLRNQRFRVVDARGRECPDWVPGELWIGGVGVARGYRNDPEATSRRFVESASGRWYRTGDLGCYWPDGTLEFLGRTDFQVKVGGHRIELGEIEAALASHPRVTRAVAVVAGRGLRRLRAFVVASGGSLDSEELRRHLAERLPWFMMPVSLTVLDALPLGESGKVDRAELERLVGEAREASGDEGEPPRGPLEDVIARVWSEILCVPRVGRGQGFLALGGDSLLATRMVEAVRGRLGVTLSLRQVFESPTVAELARTVDRLRSDRGDPELEEGVI
jgi:amino acid adenylation domain-containing protein